MAYVHKPATTGISEVSNHETVFIIRTKRTEKVIWLKA